jgi:hypothetical protein
MGGVNEIVGGIGSGGGGGTKRRRWGMEGTAGRSVVKRRACHNGRRYM